MNNALLQPVEELQRLSTQLFQSLGPHPARQPPLPSVAAILQADTTLANALHLARQHQRRQRRIESLMAEIADLDESLRAVYASLNDGKRELDDILDDADDRLAKIEKAKEASVPYPELLAYAQTLSSFTSAPPGVSLPDSNAPPPPLFFPPFPNEEKMRRGRLNAEAPLGMPGEVHSVGRPPTPDKPTQNVNGANQRPVPIRNGFGHDHRLQQQDFDFLDLDLNPDL